MQFKHPELLYALFLLVIPIIIHLFQLRKFKKVPFTNVAFLKEATLQTRKSSQIKKWVILFTRLLLLAALIFAFAQPFTSKNKLFKVEKETVIYLDNSFSMQAKGNQGVLFKRAIQDLIAQIPENENISLFTNDNIFKNTTVKALKNDLLNLDYASNNLTNQAALLKGKALFSKRKTSLKHFVFISDFQEDSSHLQIVKDTLTNYHFIQLEPVNTNNIAVDSAYISEETATYLELQVVLKSTGTTVENLPISLFNNDDLIAKTSVSFETQITTLFQLPVNEIIDGKIVIEDSGLQFDNTLFFNINTSEKINVLSINAANDSFLKRMYNNDEFNYKSTPLNQLNYTNFESQNLIILNELNTIPNALISALKQFTEQGGAVVLIPSKNAVNASYNQFLSNYKSAFNTFTTTEKRITSINYAHPLYNKGVFEKQVTNFQYPKVNSYYNATSQNGSNILQYEDGKPFLFKNKNAFIFSAPLNDLNSSFKSSPLIVPTLYNMAKFSLNIPEVYYTIGKQNTYDVKTQMQQDDILSLVNGDQTIIPEQRYFNNKVVIKTDVMPTISGIYNIKNKDNSIKNVSYNYSRNESNLTYKSLKNINDVTRSNSITEAFDTIKSDTKINALWKWFVIFALLLLIIEMVILKIF